MGQFSAQRKTRGKSELFALLRGSLFRAPKQTYLTHGEPGRSTGVAGGNLSKVPVEGTVAKYFDSVPGGGIFPVRTTNYFTEVGNYLKGPASSIHARPSGRWGGGGGRGL